MVLSFVAELIGMTAAGFVLTQTADTAVQLFPVQWYSKVHFLVQVAGVERVTCLLGSLGLCLAFLCVACATAVPTLVRKKRFPFLETPCFGLTIFLGCGTSGSLLGWSCATLLAWGLTGFCGFAFIFSLVLLFMNKWHIMESPSRMLILHTMTLATMYLGMCCGQVVDIQNPRLCFLNFLLLPAMCIMGFLLTTFMLRKHSQCIIFSFVLLVPLSGFVLGVRTGHHHGEEPLIYNTFYTIRFLVYTLEILTGLLGAFGGVCISLWDPDRAARLALWISLPAAVTLHLLHADSPHTDLLGVNQQWAGAGGALGLMSGLAAASGLALGLAIMSATEAVCVLALLIPGAADVDIMQLGLRQAAEGASRDHPHALANAAASFAFLGVVMMGATILGVAGVLTAALGSVGRHGAVLAGILSILKAVHYFSK